DHDGRARASARHSRSCRRRTGTGRESPARSACAALHAARRSDGMSEIGYGEPARLSLEKSPMEQAPDRKRVQEFARKLFGHYTRGMLTTMVRIGHKTGLFDAIAKGPATSQGIADRAGLAERYVREWLGAMVTGGIIQYDPASTTFTLPPEHAVCLTGSS